MSCFRNENNDADADDDADQPDIVQDFVARVRNPTLVMLEWTPPRRPGVIKYRVRRRPLCVSTLGICTINRLTDSK